MENTLPLRFIWNIRMKLTAEGNKLRAEGNKLRAEGNKLHAEGSELHAESNKLYAEGSELHAESNKLHAEGDKLYAEGDKLWAEAIIEVYGNIKIEWKNWDEEKQSFECHLENGEVYKPSDVGTKSDSDTDNIIAELEKRGRIKNGKVVV